MRYCFIALLFFISISGNAQTSDTVFYSVVGNGFVKGLQKAWTENNNEHHFIFQFNDRGRGDSIVETIISSGDGLIVSSLSSGVDYYKAPYRASFSVEGDSAVWFSNSLRKSRKNTGQFYFDNIAPGSVELLIRWLMKQPQHKGFILSDDSIRLDNPITKTISFNNQRRTLVLCPLYIGQNTKPVYFWLSPEGRFFGDVESWNSTIVRGYENWTDTLLAIQEETIAPLYTAEVNEYSSPLKKHFLLTHTKLFNSVTATVQNDMSVEIRDNKIVSIFPSATKSKLAVDTVINANGKFLMPGIWDMHSHYDKESGSWYIAGGVTHVRDMGNMPIITTWQKQIRANELLGPDISYLSGFIDKEDPLQGPVGKIVPSLDEALKAIDDFHKKGYNQIKLYSSIKPEWVKPMAARAHSYGMRVAGHVPAYMKAEQAINAGYNEVTHMNMIFLNFLGGDTLATNGIARLRVPPALGGTVNLDGDAVKNFIALMKKKSISLDPTINLYEGDMTEHAGDTSHMFKPIVDWLPETMKKNLPISSPFASKDQEVAYLASYKNFMKMLKMLYDNGILLVPGTDGGNAIALHRELELYNIAGIPAAQVLKIATYNAARDCGLENRYGQIRRGVEADLILVDGNPSEHISDIRKVQWVIKNGRMYSPKQLYASKGWNYYY